MAWLGWAGEWTGYNRKCGVTGRCYIPMWPMLGGEAPSRRPPYEEVDHGEGGYRPSRPGWEIDEKDSWEPRFVGIEYIMAGGIADLWTGDWGVVV